MVPEREGDDGAKRRIREALGVVRAALPSDTGRRLSAIACERLASTNGFRRTRHVAAYVALRGEPDPARLVRLALAAGKRVYLPGDADGVPCFRRAGADGRPTDEGARLSAGADTTVFVVPGVAFDAEGWRLGRGRGIYDRLLRDHPDSLRVGFAFDFQIVPHIPRAEWDVRMTAVVTEVREIWVDASRRTLPWGAVR